MVSAASPWETATWNGLSALELVEQFGQQLEEQDWSYDTGCSGQYPTGSGKPLATRSSSPIRRLAAPSAEVGELVQALGQYLCPALHQILRLVPYRTHIQKPFRVSLVDGARHQLGGRRIPQLKHDGNGGKRRTKRRTTGLFSPKQNGAPEEAPSLATLPSPIQSTANRVTKPCPGLSRRRSAW